MTACVTGLPSFASAISFISRSTSAEISGTASAWSRTFTRTEWFGPSTILYEQTAFAFFTSSEKK